MTRRRGKPRLGKTGCLFWLFIFLVIIVIILYRGKGSFRETFSQLRNRLSTQEVQETDEGGTTPEEENVTIIEESESSAAEETTEEQVANGTVGEVVENEQRADESETVRDSTEAVSTKELRAPLYFVKIEADGSALLQPAIRTVAFKDSPITRTIESLLKGPTQEEASRGLISFIPYGTVLRSAQLNGGILTLDFSSNFEQNFNGREAINFQLSQIMLTSFEFSRVSGLTILIDGKRKQYITGEGIPLKEIYTKDDLSILNTRG
jgi:spore germination protein GerM